MDNRPNAFANTFPFLWPWPPASATLEQPILPGWSFGNVVVNQQNSAAPDTELTIVSEVSYGRQIGKLIDAVTALIGDRGEMPTSGPLAELVALSARVEDIKTRSAARRIEQVRQDLDRLKQQDPAAYERETAALRQLLDR